MRKLCLLFISIFVLSCSSNDNSNTDAGSSVLIDVSPIVVASDDTSAVIKFKLSNPISVEKIITLKSNDSSRINFADGDSVDIIFTPSNYMYDQLVDIDLSLDALIVCDSANYKDLSISFYMDNNEIAKKYIDVKVMPNNPYAPLTVSLNKNEYFFNISNANYTNLTYDIMDKDNPNIIDVTKKYNNNISKIDIFGLYYGIDNNVQLSLYDENDNKCYEHHLIVPTDNIILPNINVKAKNEIYMAKYDRISPGWLLYSNEYSTIFDLRGNLRGYFKHDILNLGLPIKFFGDHFEIEGYSYLYRKIDMVGNILYELNLHDLTNTLDKYDVHHDFIEIPAGPFKGKYVFLVSKIGTPYIEDYIIIVDMDNKTLVKEMDMKKIFPTDKRFVSNAIPENDWLHQNSIEYDLQDDAIIFSARHQGVAKIKMPENDNSLDWGGDASSLIWFLTPHKGITVGQQPNVYDKLLQPVDKNGDIIEDQWVKDGYGNHPDFEWNYMQHSAILLQNGNLLIYDNGDGRFFKTTAQLSADNQLYSRYVEYKIDEDNMTVQQVYEYGREDGINLYSQIMSNVGVYDNNILFMFSAWQFNNKFSTYVEWEKNSKELLYQVRSYFNEQTYRVYKMNYFDYMNMNYNNIE